jgi:hypothetical protein
VNGKTNWWGIFGAAVVALVLATLLEISSVTISGKNAAAQVTDCGEDD